MKCLSFYIFSGRVEEQYLVQHLYDIYGINEIKSINQYKDIYPLIFDFDRVDEGFKELFKVMKNENFDCILFDYLCPSYFIYKLGLWTPVLGVKLVLHAVYNNNYIFTIDPIYKNPGWEGNPGLEHNINNIIGG